jgi:hypothetical protein
MVETMRTVSERVIRTVAEATDTDPATLPPLYESVDPDALNELVESMSDGEISFTYVGREVTVDSDGGVRLAGSFTRGSRTEAVVSGD